MIILLGLKTKQNRASCIKTAHSCKTEIRLYNLLCMCQINACQVSFTSKISRICEFFFYNQIWQLFFRSSNSSLAEDLGRFPFNFALGISRIFVWMLVWISEIQQFPRFLETFPRTDFRTICLWFQLFESFAWMENAPYLFFWKCLLTLHASPKCPLLRCMW